MSEELTTPNGVNDTPQSDYREMSEAELDVALADTQIVEHNAPEPEPTPELDGLQPTPSTPDPQIEDFAEPLADFEVHNLNVALHETPEGVDFAIALHQNQGVLTPDLIDQAKAVGISDRQIDGYISHQVHTANKVFNDAGLSLDEGRAMMRRVQNEFSPEEMSIFMKETEQNPTQSLKTLKAYFEHTT